MAKPVIRYARNGAVKLAYQVVGQGSFDLVLVPGFPSNLEILWEDPGYAHLIKRLQTFSRVILFDRRGTGLSDRMPAASSSELDLGCDDICAVMDATGCGRAAVVGTSDGAALAMQFAARHRERLRGLILHAAGAAAGSAFPDARRQRSFLDDAEASWGTGALLARFVPGRHDDRAFAEWWARLERLSASPSEARGRLGAPNTTEVLDSLPNILVPTLVLHRTGDLHIAVERGRQVRSAIKDAHMVELPGRDHPIWAGDVDGIADQIEEFLTGERPMAQNDRVLAALLVVQVLGTVGGVARTNTVQHRGERIEIFREASLKLVTRHGADARWNGGDRIEARFPGVARATACAMAVRDLAASQGLTVAQGLHVGEIDVPLLALPGNALDVAARIAASTRRPEILLSRLARDFVAGSGLQFVDRPPLNVDGAAALPIVALTSERHLEPISVAHAAPNDLATLSPREREVLALVAEGLSNPRIAVQLGLSEHTVKRHVANILLKLDLPTRAAAAGLAARHPHA